ncbi:MAG TPA: pyridoxal phosphate-dependent aminotransferase [Thermoanaerobaculia bacterium]|nr:pyridoxal phosphate-dependent aminotransferase [Thermoanaerobaculia bacterium]
MAPRVSTRARTLPASPIRKLAPLAEEALQRGIKVHSLNIGQPDIETPIEIRSRLDGLSCPVIAYSASCGELAYLDTLIRYYRRIGIELGAGEIIATTGASEAILFTLLACADPGDEVIVVEPFYTNYKAFACMAGLRLVPVPADARRGFHLPPREVWEAAITPRTRLVILCNPNNPTGAVYTPQELAMVADFVASHDLFLLSDEVYRELVYDGRQTISALALPRMEERVIVADSLSKRYSACGLRLGCLVTRNPTIYDAALRMAQARLSAPALAQLGAVGIDDLGEAYAAGLARTYQRRRDVLYEKLSRVPGVEVSRPEGAFYLIATLPVDDADEFAAWMLGEFEYRGATVMLAPAADFHVTPGAGRNQVRLAFVLNEHDLTEAVDVLAEALAVYAGGVEARGSALARG